MPLILRLSAFGGIRTRGHTRPQGRESNKDSRPVRSTTDSYEGIPAGDFLSFTASRKHGIGLPATLGYVHSDGSGRSVSDMPFGQDGTATQVNQENPLEDISEGPNRVYRFGPSNPLTILPCTLKNVKSRHARRGARVRRTGGTAAVPSRFCRPVGSCRACATSRSCSRCTGTRIRAAAPRTPPP